MNPSSLKISDLLFVTGVFVCLLQLWLPDFYLTCDGPCHLANARIVHDFWSGSNLSVFERFYSVVYTADPNSMTTFFLATLFYVVKGAVAEKLFLSIYVLVFCTGFSLLLRRLCGRASVWQSLVFLFVFTYAFAKGFYNFSLGTGFFFWMVLYWLKYLEERRTSAAVLFVVFCGLTYFTHLLPFVFGCIVCGSVSISHVLASDDAASGKRLIKVSGLLLLLLSPFVLLSLLFTNGEGGLQLHLSPHPYRLIELFEFKYIINLVDGERLWAGIAGGVLSILLLLTGIKMLPKYRLHKYDGFFLALVVITFVYVFFPEDFLGRTIIISIRAQLFVMALVACCIAFRMPEGRLRMAGGVVLFLCFIVLSVYRINCRRGAAVALGEYVGAADCIGKGEVVLPLDFSPSGRYADGREIAKRNAIFHHAGQYLTAIKPVVVLDNYEAGMGYFPVRWLPSVNPYAHLSRGAGIEGLPPYADIGAYTKQTGVAVDHVLLWCYDERYLSDGDFSKLYEDIQRNYHIAYRSKSNRVVLYSRN